MPSIAQQNTLLLIARIFFSLLFIFAGLGKIFGFPGTVMYVESVGLTFYPAALVVIAIIFELGGGLAVLLGWHTRFGAMILFIFTLTVSLAIHHFWSYAFEERQLQMILFMKNLSILGGALYIYCFGAGRYSIDAKLNKGY